MHALFVYGGERSSNLLPFGCNLPAHSTSLLRVIPHCEARLAIRPSMSAGTLSKGQQHPL